MSQYAYARPEGSRNLVALVVAALIAAMCVAGVTLAVSAVAPSSAHAYSSGYFCNYGPIPAGGRCVDGNHLRHRSVTVIPWFAPYGGQYCAGAKQYSNGTGGNTTPFACAPPAASFARAGPYNYGETSHGYATMINETGYSHGFSGEMTWYP
jgi:hypothetical protein